nr:low molecular weight phosphatase family protein [Zhihengliuella flava]
MTVCTGNICRSPLAHLYLAAHLEAMAPGAFHISSAGMAGLTGQSMDERSAAILAATDVPDGGYSVDSFTARRIEDVDLGAVDLVLAMSREHRDSIIARSPRLLKRAYTVRELARLLELIEAEHAGLIPTGAEPEAVDRRWKAVIKYATLLRTRATGGPADDDVTDPYRRADAVYEEMADQLIPALRAILAFEERFARG